jgi:acyl-CoA thioester hydrolase
VSEQTPPEARSAYRHFLAITTRWNDNDSYRHVNNAVYYEYFDTVVNEYLISKGVLNLDRSSVIGLVVETRCRFFSQIAFPSTVHAGLRVVRLGNSSIKYEIGLFQNERADASAQGHFVHVYVDRSTNRPVPLPAELKAALAPLLITSGPGALGSS